jgi:ribosome-binding protein aMBF1 (putative translation factor)
MARRNPNTRHSTALSSRSDGIPSQRPASPMNEYRPFRVEQRKDIEPGESELYELIAERIADARARAGLTQQALADRIHISRAQVANLENFATGTKVHILYRIAEACGVPITEILPEWTRRR